MYTYVQSRCCRFTISRFPERMAGAVEASGETEAVFISTDNTGYVAETMYNYCEVKKQIEGMGLKLPVFIEGLKVTNYQPKSLTRDHAADDQYH